MIDYTYTLQKINELMNYAFSEKNLISLLIITSLKEKTLIKNDYAIHSIVTSYLSRENLDELLSFFRESGIYTSVYLDVELFIKDFYNKKINPLPNLIFETGAKGIGRGKESLLPCICDLLQIKHLGSNANTNCLCSSKYQWTSILRNHEIMVPESSLFHSGCWIHPLPEGKKILLKLNYECASIGLTKDSLIINDNNNSTNKASEMVQIFHQPVIAQEFIAGYEVEVPIIINNTFKLVLPPVGLCIGEKKFFENDFFDYNHVYTRDFGFYDFRDVNENITEQLINYSFKIIDILDLSGYMRIDFRVTDNDQCYVIDINNDPDINSTGSFLKSLRILGLQNSCIAPVLIGNSLI